MGRQPHGEHFDSRADRYNQTTSESPQVGSTSRPTDSAQCEAEQDRSNAPEDDVANKRIPKND